MGYDLIHKPTFTTQLLALPSSEIPHVLQKVGMLESSPQPDAKVKKQLKGYRERIYRIRSGNYRIIYTFGKDDSGNGWVVLLGVDHRKDVYEDDDFVADAPTFDLDAMPRGNDLLAPKQEPQQWPTPAKASHVTDNVEYLPVKFDRELLTRMRIPDGFHDRILACETLDDLTAANIPDSTRDRLFDVAYTPNYDLVVQQPSFETGSTDDLIRYVEGELLDFLLRLDPEQEKYVTWAINGAGPTLVKGSPGTGKSTIALYRVRSLLQALKNTGVEEPKILFTTYTNALVRSSKQLLERMLGDNARLVDVRTADSLVTRIAKVARDKTNPISGTELENTLEDAAKRATETLPPVQRQVLSHLITRLSNDYILDELEGVIVARELETVEDYLKEQRTGRKIGLTAPQRAVLWELNEALEDILAERNQTTFGRRRLTALDAVRGGIWEERYDGVVVDESQDLPPAVLRLLVSLCRQPDRIFVTADANQSIYGSSFKWADVHQDLNFVGRTGILKRNHRSTREISEAAQSYLRNAELDSADAVTIQYVASGPLPTVRYVESRDDETTLLARFLRNAAKEFRLGLGACAVLTPGNAVGQDLAERLCEAGVEAAFMRGNQLDLESKSVKVITQKSAKGLEFPIVAVAGLLDAPRTEPATEEEALEQAERMLEDQRTVYVAMTRAMRALLVILPKGHSSPLFTGFDDTLWNTGAQA